MSRCAHQYMRSICVRYVADMCPILKLTLWGGRAPPAAPPHFSPSCRPTIRHCTMAPIQRCLPPQATIAPALINMHTSTRPTVHQPGHDMGSAYSLWTLAGRHTGHMTCQRTPDTKYSSPLLSSPSTFFSSSLALTIISPGRPHGDTELSLQCLDADLLLLPRRRVLQSALAQTFQIKLPFHF